MYTIEQTRTFNKAFRSLPSNVQRTILGKIENLAAAPYAAQNVKKMQGIEAYRLRVGDYRVIYELKDSELVLLLLDVGSRGGIYNAL